MSFVCRICLHQIYGDNFVNINNNSVVRNQLSLCIPELTMELVTNPIMCTPCGTALDFAYSFKNRCLQTEKRVLNHLNGASPSIDSDRLIEVLYASINAKNTIKQELNEISELESRHDGAYKSAINCSNEITDSFTTMSGIDDDFVIKEDVEDLDCKPCDSFAEFDESSLIMEGVCDEADTSSRELQESASYSVGDQNFNDSSVQHILPWKNSPQGTQKDRRAPLCFGTTSSCEIDDIIGQSVPMNTKRSQIYIWNRFMKFCRKKGYTVDENTSVEQISQILKDWGYNMKKTNGSDYKETVVKTMWNVTAKLIQEMYYKKYKVLFNPFNDIVFKSARDARNAKRKQLRSHPDKRKASSVPLTSQQYNEVIRSWDENTPHGLQRKFYHIAAFELSWGRFEATNCKVYYFKQEVNYSGAVTGRLEYNPAFTRTNYRYLDDPHSKWLTPNSNDPDVCPVRLFKKLLSKRNANITVERLFLTVNPFWMGEKPISWFKNSPVGINEISKWMKTAARKVGLDTNNIKITNPPSQTAVSQSMNPSINEFIKISLLNYNPSSM